SFGRIGLTGLADAEARELLRANARGGLAQDVINTLVAVCAGNPLGLLQLPLALSDAQRRGDEPLPELIQAGPSIQNAFAARAATLSAPQQHAVLVIAANGGADQPLIHTLGISPHAINALIESGL